MSVCVFCGKQHEGMCECEKECACGGGQREGGRDLEDVSTELENWPQKESRRTGGRVPVVRLSGIQETVVLWNRRREQSKRSWAGKEDEEVELSPHPCAPPDAGKRP